LKFRLHDVLRIAVMVVKHRAVVVVKHRVISRVWAPCASWPTWPECVSLASFIITPIFSARVIFVKRNPADMRRVRGIQPQESCDKFK
jgi:hypothetical protein